jgi:AcrR family transcriptional regulator
VSSLRVGIFPLESQAVRSGLVNGKMVAMTTVTEKRYHHGDLRRALLDELAAAIVDGGPSHVSVREVARRAGVSHTAAAYHFADKTGLVTALAAQGHSLLATALEAARDDGFLAVGVAYVHFSVEHPAHFQVMWRPDLVRMDDPELAAARARSGAVLYGGVSEATGTPTAPEDRAATLSAGLAAWALVHGLSMLHLAGVLPAGLPSDVDELTRAVAVHLGGHGRGRRRRTEGAEP